jgi:hypothetical protein
MYEADARAPRDSVITKVAASHSQRASETTLDEMVHNSRRRHETPLRYVS